jgi:NAD(P)H-dependent flavin oxidoreductase YrpB (nitropropane dioxygenase family)
MSGAPDAIALIPAGGIDGPAGVRALRGAGAAPVRLDTAFAVTEEGDAHRAFKAVLAAAMNGDVHTGLFFRGAGRPPFGSRIRPVADLLRALLTPVPGPV